MTENKRYSDGSLAKWYYSRDYNGMRVISNGVDEFALQSKKQFKDINSKELKGTNQLLDELNKLEDKIINLEKENTELKEQLKDCQQKKQNIKDVLMNSEPVVEQKKLQKLIYQQVINLIDEKIRELENINHVSIIPRESIEVLEDLKRELL